MSAGGTLARLLADKGLRIAVRETLSASASASAVVASAGDPFARRMRDVAAVHGLDVADLMCRIDADADQMAALSDAELGVYLRAIACTATRERGEVPIGWIAVRNCAGCGPVWLWPSAPNPRACPWCWSRRRGLPVPRPSEVANAGQAGRGSSAKPVTEGNSGPVGSVVSALETDLTASATN